MGLGLAIIKEH